MADVKPEPKPELPPPLESLSQSITIVGVVNAAPSGIPVPSYASMSYTLPMTVEEDTRSKPLSQRAIRVVDSVIHARVRESAIQRDTDEDS